MSALGFFVLSHGPSCHKVIEKERQQHTTAQQHNAEEETIKGGENNEREEEETSILTFPKFLSVELISEIQFQTGPAGIKLGLFPRTGVQADDISGQ